ncbi:MAG: Rrf2 family transcriptional regulator [Verrucomicrobiaceae bacterium]|nr:Rrf2 family transcriptional regulator [Verrucomicrobiaceae bacterium]
MELSLFTDYSLRVLIRAAACKEGERTSAREIAQTFAISYNHVVKVTHHLAKLGYLDTARGRNGGVALSRPASQIGIGEIVRKTENFALVECFKTSGNACCISPACKLKRIFAEARDAFLNCLDRYSLDEITSSQATLTLLLSASRN